MGPFFGLLEDAGIGLEDASDVRYRKSRGRLESPVLN